MIKKTICTLGLALATFVFLFFFITPDISEAKKARCNTFTITPTTGTTSTIFEVEATGCIGEFANYQIVVYNSAGNPVAGDTVTTDEESKITYIISDLSEEGSFKVKLIFGTEVVNVAGFEITSVKPLTCGSTVPENTPSCKKEGELGCCPPECPSVFLPGGCTNPNDPTTCTVAHWECYNDTPPPEEPETPKTEPGSKLKCEGDENTINTAIGCINYIDMTLFASFVLSWSIGIGGLIFIFLSAYSGFLIMTSSGNPRRLKVGHEILLSAVAGLIMLFFSIFILRVIGVNILGIFT